MKMCSTCTLPVTNREAVPADDGKVKHAVCPEPVTDPYQHRAGNLVATRNKLIEQRSEMVKIVSAIRDLIEVSDFDEIPSQLSLLRSQILLMQLAVDER